MCATRENGGCALQEASRIIRSALGARAVVFRYGKYEQLQLVVLAKRINGPRQRTAMVHFCASGLP